MENLDKVKSLLEKVRQIKEREKELSKLRGEHFNIFRLLGMESDEAGMHTKFLFELLNPEGSHGKGKVFFDSFMVTLTESFKDFVIPSYLKIEEQSKEKHIGKVDFESENGGSIDLYFETESFCLVIENKIYSILGHKQLERYFSFISNKGNKTPILLLLTPNGYGGYKGNLEEGKHFFQITYKGLILKWLEICHQKASDSPILRETIKQYIITVKGILGMLTNQEMSKDLQELIKNYLDEARLIADNFNLVKGELKEILFSKTIQILNEKSIIEGFQKIDFKEKDIYIKDGGFSLRSNSWIEGLYLYFEGAPNLASEIIVQEFVDIRNFPNKNLIEKYKNEIRYQLKISKKGEDFDRITYEKIKLNNIINSLNSGNIASLAESLAQKILDFWNNHKNKLEEINIKLVSKQDS